MIDRCPTCKRRKTRSSPANARYWLLLHAIADKVSPEGKQYSAETWHSYFKQRYIGAEEVKLPNGKTLLQVNSSAELDTEDFAIYMQRVEIWAGEHGVYLQDFD